MENPAHITFTNFYLKWNLQGGTKIQVTYYYRQHNCLIVIKQDKLFLLVTMTNLSSQRSTPHTTQCQDTDTYFHSNYIL